MKNILYLGIALFYISQICLISAAFTDLNMNQIMQGVAQQAEIDKFNAQYKLQFTKIILNGKLVTYPLYLKQTGTVNKLCVVMGSGIHAGQTSLISLFYDFGPMTLNSKNFKTFNINDNSWAKKCNLLFIDPVLSMGYTSAIRQDTQSDLTTAQNSVDILNYLNEKETIFTGITEMYFVGTGYHGKIAPRALKILRDSSNTLATLCKGLLLANPTVQHKYLLNNTYDIFQLTQQQFLYDKNFIGEATWSTLQKCELTQQKSSPSCLWAYNEYEKAFENNSFNEWNVYDLCQVSPSEQKQKAQTCLNLDPVYDVLQKIALQFNDQFIKFQSKNFFNKDLAYFEEDETIKELSEIISSNSYKVEIINGITSSQANYILMYDLIQFNLGLFESSLETMISYVPSAPEGIGCQIGGFTQQFASGDSKITFVKIQKGGYYPSHWTPEQSYAVFKDFLNIAGETSCNSINKNSNQGVQE